MKLFAKNLRLSIQALQHLDRDPSALEIGKAIDHILESVQSQYTYLLTYRFGPKEAEAMLNGLDELRTLANWAHQQNLQMKVSPIRKYYSIEEQREIAQTTQDNIKNWM